MSKPTYYLWRTDFPSQEEFEEAKSRFTRLGFRVVTYKDGDTAKNIHEGLRAIIRNHMQHVV